MPPKKPDFEQQLERLAAIVEELEGGELPLEKGVALFKEGVGLAKGCREQLAKARHEVKLVAEEGLRDLDGAPKPIDGPAYMEEEEPHDASEHDD